MQLTKAQPQRLTLTLCAQPTTAQCAETTLNMQLTKAQPQWLTLTLYAQPTNARYTADYGSNPMATKGSSPMAN